MFGRAAYEYNEYYAVSGGRGYPTEHLAGIIASELVEAAEDEALQTTPRISKKVVWMRYETTRTLFERRRSPKQTVSLLENFSNKTARTHFDLCSHAGCTPGEVFVPCMYSHASGRSLLLCL